MEPDSSLAPALAALYLDGADAGSFLQSQLTADMSVLDVGQWTAAAWLNPKGRVLGLLRVARLDVQCWLALVESDHAHGLVERLLRFKLRSRFTHHWHEGPMTAIVDAAVRVARVNAGESPELSVPQVGMLVLAPGPCTALDQWLDAEVLAGWPRVGTSLSGRLLATAIGLAELGALSYTKGCYPGQEIVARTRYLGQAKRGLHVVRRPPDQRFAIGDEVALSEDQPAVATVVNVGRHQMLLSARLDSGIEQAQTLLRRPWASADT